MGLRGWTLAAQVVPALLAIVLLKLQVVLLDPATFGQLALVVAAATLLQTVVFSGIANAFSRFIPSAQEPGVILSALWAAAQRRWRWWALGAMLLIVAATWRLPVLLVLTGVAFSAAAAVAGMLDAACIGFQRPKVQVSAAVAGGAVRIGATALLCGYLTLGAFGALCSLVAGTMAAVLVSRRLLPIASGSPDPDRVRAILAFSTTYIWWSVAAWLPSGLARWLVEGARGSAEVGYLAMAQMMVMPLVLVGAALNAYVAPGIFRGWDEGNFDARSFGRLRGLALGIFAIGLLIPLVAGPVVTLLVGQMLDPRYLPCAPMVGPLGLGACVFAAGQILSTCAIADDPRRISTAKIACPVGIAMGAAATIPVWGAISAAWAEAIGQMIFFGWVLRVAGPRLNQTAHALPSDGRR